MKKNIFESQNELIDDIRNKILQLVEKYNKCREKLSFDYLSSKISYSIYELGMSKKIMDYDISLPLEYQLSIEEIQYLRNNADLTVDGEITTNVINQKYIAKKNLLDLVLNSIRIPYFLDTLNDYDKRTTFYNIVESYFNEEIIKTENVIRIYQNRYGKYCDTMLDYINLVKKRYCLIKEKESYLNNIKNSTLDEFMNLVEKFYKINITYYNWYIRKYLKEEGKLPLAIRPIDNSNEKEEALEDISNTIDKINECIHILGKYYENFPKFIIEASNIEKESSKLSIYDKAENNKLFLYELFLKYAKLVEFIPFIDYLSSTGNIDEAFNNYFLRRYKDKKYVNPSDFLYKLRLDVASFYEKEINRLNEELVNYQIKIQKDKKYINFSSTNKSSKNTFIKDEETCDTIVGLSSEEEQIVYEDIKSYLEESLTNQCSNNSKLALKYC